MKGLTRVGSTSMLAGLFDEDEAQYDAQHGPENGGVGVPRPSAPRNSTKLSGLSNLGATCYLNSLLQTLHFTPEFRGIKRLRPVGYVKLQERYSSVCISMGAQTCNPDSPSFIAFSMQHNLEGNSARLVRLEGIKISLRQHDMVQHTMSCSCCQKTYSTAGLVPRG